MSGATDTASGISVSSWGLAEADDWDYKPIQWQRWRVRAGNGNLVGYLLLDPECAAADALVLACQMLGRPDGLPEPIYQLVKDPA